MYVQLNNLQKILYQNAATQFSVDFMADPSRDGEKFAGDNFGGTANGNGYELVAYYDLSGALVMKTILDNPGFEIKFPTALQNIRYGIDRFAMSLNNTYTSYNIFMTDGKLVYIVGMPIFNDTNGPVYGFALMGRVMNTLLMNSITYDTSMCFAFVQIAGDAPNPRLKDYASIISSIRTTVPKVQNSNWDINPTVQDYVLSPYDYPRFCRPTENDPNATVTARVYSTIIMQDMFGIKSLMIRVDMQRQDILLGIQSIVIAVVVLGFVIIVVSIGTVILIDFVLLRRVLALTRSLHKIVLSANVDERVSSGKVLFDDEVNRLAKLINLMLRKMAITQKSLESTLQSASEAEHMNRVIMNTVPDFLITITLDGMIQSVNTAFTSKFGYSRNDVEGKLTIDRVVALPLEEMIRISSPLVEDNVKETFLHSRVRTEIPVSISTANANIFVNDVLTPALVIFCRNDTERKALFHELIRVQFEDMWMHTERRKLFQEFCAKELSVENFNFMEAVEVYQQTNSVKQRMKLKQKIIDTYVKEESEYMLNISHKERKEELEATAESTAPPDLFNGLLFTVQKMVIIDTFSRFQTLSREQQGLDLPEQKKEEEEEMSMEDYFRLAGK